MLAGRARRRRSARGSRIRRGHTDVGASLVEVMVSIALIDTVLAATTTLFLASMSITAQQRSRQVAVHLANAAIEKVRALDGAEIVDGRDLQSVHSQWDSAPAAVRLQLAAAAPAVDSQVPPGSGLAAVLPTAPQEAIVSGTTYRQNWYIGTCSVPRYDHTVVQQNLSCSVNGGSVPMYRVVVAVTWADVACDGSTCSYLASTLVNGMADALFNPNERARNPSVTAVGDQVGHVTQLVAALQLASTGGVEPVTWSVSGLPAGLTADVHGRITGTLTTQGEYSVLVRAVDAAGREGTAGFTWKVT